MTMRSRCVCQSLFLYAGEEPRSFHSCHMLLWESPKQDKDPVNECKLSYIFAFIFMVAYCMLIP